ncbi:hypothetical protein CGLO_00108 [Colletotrichum gloeosporioides Cg-14]|uniref:Uncharacterized protein n=1 Tax=Colletotrichum gloeosporioides (strain Cg-14) TaxID=1237896 RepID=T0L4S4_COLGC|nr:hypothetical protein CGLO_00108 [Colletotrichum gloeosporioides Cg-14]
MKQLQIFYVKSKSKLLYYSTEE